MSRCARWLGGVVLILWLPGVVLAAQETPTAPPAEPSTTPPAKEKAAPPPDEPETKAKDKPDPKFKLVGLNSASKQELVALPDLTNRDVERIVKARPYKKKEDLLDRKVLSSKKYEKIKALVVADPVTKSAPK
jgi:DNA uptake protein ComE-like DNA-binding protein